MLTVLKVLLSLAVIVAVGFVARKSGGVAAGFLLSLPLTSLLALLWAKLEHTPPQRIAAMSFSTFWFVLIPLPAFLFFAFLLQRGVNFWLTLGLGLLLMLFAYLLAAKILLLFGYRL